MTGGPGQIMVNFSAQMHADWSRGLGYLQTSIAEAENKEYELRRGINHYLARSNNARITLQLIENATRMAQQEAQRNGAAANTFPPNVAPQIATAREMALRGMLHNTQGLREQLKASMAHDPHAGGVLFRLDSQIAAYEKECDHLGRTRDLMKQTELWTWIMNEMARNIAVLRVELEKVQVRSAFLKTEMARLSGHTVPIAQAAPPVGSLPLPQLAHYTTGMIASTTM
jgi:hypothetical protein